MSKAEHALNTSAPNKPTRRRVLTVGAAALAAPVAAAPVNSAHPAASPAGVWAPTELGLEIIRRLPAHAAAMYVRCNMVDMRGHPEYDREKVEAADRAVDETREPLVKICDAIMARPVRELAHLVDLAIVMRFWHCPYSEPEDDMKAARILARALLRLGRVPLHSCSANSVYKKVERSMEGKLI